MEKKNYMKYLIVKCLSMALIITNLGSKAFGNNDPYPAPEEGYRRVDIVIPYEEKINLDLISIDVGVYSKVCDVFRLVATHEVRRVDGWGYEYLYIKSDGGLLSDLMLCKDLQKPKFVPAILDFFDSPKRYPAKAPYTMVIYLPKDLKVRVEYLKEIKYQDL